MSYMDIKAASGRFDGVVRPYTEQDVQRLRGSVKVEHTLAQRGAEKLWELLKTEPYVHALGALSGNQVGGCWVRLGGEPWGGSKGSARSQAQASHVRPACLACPEHQLHCPAHGNL